MFKAIDAVLFDLYGTIADIEVDETSPSFWQGIQREFLAFGVSPPAAAFDTEAWYVRLCEEESRVSSVFTLDRVFARMLKRPKEITRASVDPHVLRFARRFRELSLRSLELKPYALPLLSLLADSDVKMALVSNTEAILSEFDLDYLGIRHWFDTIYLSSREKWQKPDAQAFAAVLERIETSPKSAVMVGDTWTTDILGAANAGLKSIYVGSDSSISELKGHDHYCIRTPNATVTSLLAALLELDVSADA